MNADALQELVDGLLGMLEQVGVRVDAAAALTVALRHAFEGRFDEASSAWSGALQAVEQMDAEAIERVASLWFERLVVARVEGDGLASLVEPVLDFLAARAGLLAPAVADDPAAALEGALRPALHWVSEACIDATIGRFRGPT